MRELERIDRIVELIRKIWKLAPDMRLGQLLENYVFDPRALFRQEDDITEKKLRELLNSSKQAGK